MESFETKCESLMTEIFALSEVMNIDMSRLEESKRNKLEDLGQYANILV